MKNHKNIRILLVCGESDNVINFRKELILFLLNKHCLVDVICSDDIRKQEILDLGVSSVNVTSYRNRSKNPFQFIKLTRFIKRVIKINKPNLVISFQAKPNLATSRALNGNRCINFYCILEGIGTVFNTKTLKQRLLSKLVSKMYKRCFKKSKIAFVLNNDDKKFLIDKKLISSDKVAVINGIGIDCAQFKPVDLPKEKNVIMLSRLIKEKGIFEYIEIAKLVKKNRKDINFYLYGQESELKVKDIQPYIDEGIIIFGGYCRDAKKVISNSRVLVLPSYYGEGLPRSILEAMALERMVIAYDNVGSRDVVFNGETGYLVDKFNRELFAKKIIESIDNNELLEQFGRNGRLKCENVFSSNAINESIFNIITNHF